MSEHLARIGASDLRCIRVSLVAGDIAFHRVDGSDVVIASDEPIDVATEDGTLRVGGPGREGRRGMHMRLGGMEMHMGPKMGMRMGQGVEATLGGELSGIGAAISDAVSSAFGSLGGLAGADVRIGIPAILERPTIEGTTGRGDIEVRDVMAEWTLKSGSGEITVEGGGGTLGLRSGRGDLRLRRFDGPIVGTTGVGDVEASAVLSHLELHTGAGEIRILGGPVGGTAVSGTGDIELIDAGGTWAVRTGSGDVQVRVRDAATLEVTTGSGDVRVDGDALMGLRLQTSSGDISVECLLLGSRHELISGNGDIQLALADPPGARLQILTGHGEIHSEYPLVRVGKQGPRSADGARYVGNVGESTIAVEVRTGSGDVHITRLRPTGAAPDAASRAAASSPGTGPAGVDGAASSGAEHWEPIAPIPPIPPVAAVAPADRGTSEWGTPRASASGNADTSPAGEWPTPLASVEESPGDYTDRGAHLADGSVARETVATRDDLTNTQGEDGDRLDILQSLQRGEIGVEDATALLEALQRRTG